MSSLYAMRRANGDWSALEDRGCSRVPVFRSSRDGMLARASHPVMLLFRPSALDEVAIESDKNHYVSVSNLSDAMRWSLPSC